MIAPFNVLFLCTGNSARSIMGEALIRQWGQRRFRGFSAGSHPKGEVHPLALETLQRYRLPTADLRSKGWEEFATADAPPPALRVHRVRSRGAGSVSGLAWPAHDRTLGHR